MAIAFDSSSSIYQGTATGSQNLSHTCSGSNRMLVVFTRTYDGDGVSGVTYNGVSMASAGASITIGSDVVKGWLLHAPATGTNNITATISPNRRIEIYAISLTGALQSSTPDATQRSTGTGTTAGGTVTTVSDNAWSIANTEANGASGTPTTGTNCTVVQAIADRGAIGYGGPKTPAGTFAQDIGWPGSGGWGFYQIAIAPSPAVGPANVKTWDGITQSTGIKQYFGVDLANVKSVNGIT